MKRILSLILILALLIPAAWAVGEDADPIIGTWYVYMEPSEGPSMEELQGLTHIIMLLTFEEDGSITFFEADYKGKTGDTAGPTTSGTWSADSGNQYKVAQIGMGEGTAYLVDDILYYPVLSNIYYVFHKAIHMNWYTEIINEKLLPSNVKRP